MRKSTTIKNKTKNSPTKVVNKNISESEVYLYNEKAVIQYSYADYTKKNHKDPEGQFITWINVDGISDAKVINEICEPYKIHPLIIEDILVPNQRAKIEEYENYSYFVLKMIYYNQDEIVFEQISVLLLDRVVITFGETKGDVFKPIRTRLQTQGSPLRNRGADYLLCCLFVEHWNESPIAPKPPMWKQIQPTLPDQRDLNVSGGVKMG